MMLASSFDYVIVGGGSAGAVLARRLAENPACEVLLIEAGPSDVGVGAIADPAAWTSLCGSAFDWGHVYAPAPHALGRAIPIPRGRVLGGSSSINAMIWYRGHADDYDQWERDGATGWNFAALLPCFRRSEDWQGGASAWRGAGGPLRIELPQDPHPIAADIAAAAARMGVPTIEDLNGESNFGACRPNLSIGNGQRWSAARGYLHPARDWPNLVVVTDSPVTDLVLEGDRCVGVRHRLDGRMRQTRARHEVILAAGAIGSPVLLMRSGIGDARALRRLGIQGRVDAPGVGDRLQDHPLLCGMNFIATAPLGPVRDQGGGVLLNWCSSASDRPDLHGFFVQGAHAGAGLARELPADAPVFALSPGLMRSRSTGFVRLASADPAAPVEIQPNYLADPADLAALVESVEFIEELAGQSPLARHILRPLVALRDHAERVEFIRRTVDTFFHCCGTCRMGSDDASVVDPALRVRGVRGLRVADASVMPTIPSCNTNAPTIMIAERAAELIAGAA